MEPVHRSIRCGALICRALAAVASGASVKGEEREFTKTEHTRVLFSANDKLCKPLAHLYDQFSRVHYYAEFTEGRLPIRTIWEDEYAERFRTIGLERVVPLKDSLHPHSPDLVAQPSYDDPFLQVIPPLTAYYKIDIEGDGRDRIVSIADLPFSRYDYSTTIWILKPGADIRPDPQSRYYSVTDDEQFPDFVESGISFDRDLEYSDQYGHVENPYLFDKIATTAEKARPARIRAAHEPAISGAVTQRLFKFRDWYVFTARNLGVGYALVYRYEHGSIDDLCYLVPQATIRYLHRQNAQRP